MDAITAATLFSNIVALVGQYRTEKGELAKADFNEFLLWLTETQHHELKSIVETNLKTSIGVKALLSEQYGELAKKLECIDSAIVSFASTFEGFSELAQGLKPKSTLSEQALSILQQFEASQASKLLELQIMPEGLTLFCIDGKGGYIEISDKRFIEDDLKVLVGLGLLRHEHNTRGDNMYIFTRNASKLVLEMQS